MLRTWLACALALGIGACGDDEPPLPAGAPDPGRGEVDPRPDPVERAGCGSASFLEDLGPPDEPGPWPVGVRTTTVDTLDDTLDVEVWYPAERGSQVGVRRVLYDVRQWLPESEAEKIPDDDAPWQICDCFRDLPLDRAHGPYPVVIFIHGTAGFRTQSLQHMEHWASRGFVVVAADYPKLFLGDLLEDPLGGFGGADLPGDTQSVLDALQVLEGDLAFLDGHIDLDRLGMSGHSAGGAGVSGFGDVARVLIPMAAGGTQDGAALEASLVFAGMDDGVVSFDDTLAGWLGSPTPKWFVGIPGAGHLAFSDICAIQNDEGQDILGIALEHGVTNAGLASALFDGCGPEYLAPEAGWDVTNYASAAVLEAALQCNAEIDGDLSELDGAFPDLVLDVREAL